jgi:hypothetical protein
LYLYIIICRAPLDERSARHRNLYLTTHNTHNRQTSIIPADFESISPANERLQTLALDCTATGIGTGVYTSQKTQFLSIKTTNYVSGIDQDSLRSSCLIKKSALCCTTWSLYKVTLHFTHHHHSLCTVTLHFTHHHHSLCTVTVHLRTITTVYVQLLSILRTITTLYVQLLSILRTIATVYVQLLSICAPSPQFFVFNEAVSCRDKRVLGTDE